MAAGRWWLVEAALLAAVLLESLVPLRRFNLHMDAAGALMLVATVVAGWSLVRGAHSTVARLLTGKLGGWAACGAGLIGVALVAAGGIWHGPPHYALGCTVVASLLFVVVIDLLGRPGRPVPLRVLAWTGCGAVYLFLLLFVDLNLLSLFPRHVSVFGALLSVAWLSSALSIIPPLSRRNSRRALMLGGAVTAVCLGAAPDSAASVAGYLRRQAELGSLLSPAVWDRALQPGPYLVRGGQACPTAPRQHVEVRGTPLRRNVLLVTIDTLREDFYLTPGQTMASEYPTLAALMAESCHYRNSHSVGAATHLVMPALYNGTMDWMSLDRPILAAVADRAGLYARVYGGLRQIGDYTGISGGLGDPRTTSNTRRILMDMDRASQEGRPWMLIAHYLDLHLPRKIELLSAWSSDLRPVYARKLAALDAELGELIGSIKERGQWDQTIVVVTADHGEELNERGYAEHAFHLYESVLRVPLIARIPGRACLDPNTPVSSLDVVPMVTDALGLAIESPALAGHWPPRAGAPLYAYSTMGGPFLSVTENGRKLIVDGRYADVEIYDLASDPHERRNLGGPLTPEIAEQLARAPLPWNPLMSLAQRYRREGGGQFDVCASSPVARRDQAPALSSGPPAACAAATSTSSSLASNSLLPSCR